MKQAYLREMDEVSAWGSYWPEVLMIRQQRIYSLVAAVALFVAIFSSGCGVPDGVSPVKPDSPVVAKDTIWSEIAKRIDSGRITDTDALILIVDDLRDADEISDNDRIRFHEAFPTIKAKRRECTPDDAKTLRGIQ